jgi:hypothetical protein
MLIDVDKMEITFLKIYAIEFSTIVVILLLLIKL